MILYPPRLSINLNVANLNKIPTFHSFGPFINDLQSNSKKGIKGSFYPHLILGPVNAVFKLRMS